MTKVLVSALFTQFFDNGGEVLDGGLIETYQGGTSTPATTWTDSTGNSAHPNPVECDSVGRVTGGIWVTPGVAYKFILKTAAGVTRDTDDNVVTGTAASSTAEEIDITFSYVGTPTAQGNMGTYPATRSFTFPVNFAGSQASVGTVPAATYEVKLYKNGVQIGTVSFDTAGTPTFATTGGTTVSFVAGDDLTAKGPDSVGTAADIGITLLADID